MGADKERFKYVKMLNEAIKEKNIAEAESCVGTLLTFTLTGLGRESDEAEDLEQFEKKCEREKIKNCLKKYNKT